MFYKNIFLTDNAIKLKSDDIKKFEKQCKIKLPTEYYDYLLSYNGSNFHQNTYSMLEEIEEGYHDEGLKYLFYISKGTSYDKDLKHNVLLYQQRIPTDLIPIGHAPCGNLICLCIKGKNYNKVYFWNHESESDEDEESNYDNVYLISNSFAEFINGLYKSDIEEDENGEDINISIHDKYSLPTSHHIKKHGKVMKDFFNKAPKDVKEFIIKEFTADGDLLLLFKSYGKKHFRRLNKNGKIIEESNRK